MVPQSSFCCFSAQGLTTKIGPNSIKAASVEKGTRGSGHSRGRTWNLKLHCGYPSVGAERGTVRSVRVSASTCKRAARGGRGGALPAARGRVQHQLCKVIGSATGRGPVSAGRRKWLSSFASRPWRRWHCSELGVKIAGAAAMEAVLNDLVSVDDLLVRPGLEGGKGDIRRAGPEERPVGARHSTQHQFCLGKPNYGSRHPLQRPAPAQRFYFVQ